MSRSTLLLGLAVTLALMSTRWVRFNTSPSLPVGLYRLRAVPAVITREMLVVLPVPASVHHVWPRWVPLLKPVAGVVGDVVCHEAQRLTVNGLDYGAVYREAQGRALPQLDAGCQQVPEGMVFMASQVPKSIDARYFGMMPMAAVTAQATPLLTWR